MTQNTNNTSKREFRRLMDLNLIDNFLFQQMLSRGGWGTKNLSLYQRNGRKPQSNHKGYAKIHKGINYMKSWEYEKMIEEKAREAGYNSGFDNGFNDGFNDGLNNGTEKMSQLIIRLTDSGRTEDIEKQPLFSVHFPSARHFGTK